MRTNNIDVANLMIDFYKTIGFYVATGFDPAICEKSEGEKEAAIFYEHATDSEIKDLVIYFASLRELKGWKYSNELCQHLNGVKRFPLIAQHLCLSIYS